MVNGCSASTAAWPEDAMPSCFHAATATATSSLSGFREITCVACEKAYAALRAQVEGGIQDLRRDVRPADQYRDFVARSAWETLYDATAPGPAGYE